MKRHLKPLSKNISATMVILSAHLPISTPNMLRTKRASGIFNGNTAWWIGKAPTPERLETANLERFDKLVRKYGVLRLLKKGLEVDDAHFTLLYQLPMASSGKTVKENFAKNEFSVTRQIHYSLENTNASIDMVLFVNGLPFATMELKNHWTGQNAKVHGQNQYKFNRDNRQPLLEFGRCLVHLATDTDEVYMTTRLEVLYFYAEIFPKYKNKNVNQSKIIEAYQTFSKIIG